ncbi:hypothetical protein K438DRAFT_1766777 [Mycena galopus ATCC 62051]|nr:hypothetical protein K438DRAFT_1766777 [Mycena galopus ATCC 62051]
MCDGRFVQGGALYHWQRIEEDLFPSAFLAFDDGWVVVGGTHSNGSPLTQPIMPYTFPQSVTIAGGRPSSSDTSSAPKASVYPTSTPPLVTIGAAAPLLAAPPPTCTAVPRRPCALARPRMGDLSAARGGLSAPSTGTHATCGGSLNPELVRRGGSMSPERHVLGRGHSPMMEDELVWAPAEVAAHGSTTLMETLLDSTTRPPAKGALTSAKEAHFARVYSAAELKTFHCERVRKMPLTGLDPSMLIGFGCRDEVDWVDLRRRVAEVSAADEILNSRRASTWPGTADDDDMGPESLSDPEESPRETTKMSRAHRMRRPPVRCTPSQTHLTSRAPPSPTCTRTRTPQAPVPRRAAARSEEVDTEEAPSRRSPHCPAHASTSAAGLYQQHPQARTHPHLPCPPTRTTLSTRVRATFVTSSIRLIL